MYLLVLVVLSMSATSLGMLLFDMVNVYLPDPLRLICSYDGCASSINAEIAVLLVAFPVLVWAWRFLQRDLRENPGKSDLWVRRWLLYLSLFVSGITAIIDIIALVQSWLNGDLTQQFLLKVVIVLAIALAIFYYFLRELHPQKGRNGSRLVAWGAIAVVIASLAVGINASAPWDARERASDMQRVNDLGMLQSEIVNFWIAKSRLPVALGELEDSVSGFKVPVDPLTGDAYSYEKTNSATFNLCATFVTATVGSGKTTVPRPVSNQYLGDPYSSDWSHGVGRMCFERKIDPQLYPPNRTQ